jgi:hypothetical protein
MTPRPKNPASPSKEKKPAAPDPTLDLTSPEAYEQALQDLQIDAPIYTCRILNNRLEFRLYGGRVLFWPTAPVKEG